MLPGRLNSFFRWWRSAGAAADDIDQELRAHLALEAEAQRERGASSEDAEAIARRDLGNLSQVKEQIYKLDARVLREQIGNDVLYGLRMLSRAPGWTAALLSLLTIGGGLATAMFSFFYGILLKPLPYHEPERVVAIWSTAPQLGYPRLNVSAADWQDWRAQTNTLVDIALTKPVANFNLTGSGEPERLQGARTTWNLWSVLGVPPHAGRFFTEAEIRSDAHVAVLSYALWRRRFNQDSSLIGKKIQLNGEPYEVVGVAPESFQYPTREFELWAPIHIDPEELRSRLGNDYRAVARLKSGVTLHQAQAELSAMAKRISKAYPELRKTLGPQGVELEPLLKTATERVRRPLTIAMTAAAVLLVIVALNSGILLLVRMNGRSRELAVRAAVGADRRRLMQQMVAEVLPLGVLAVLGATTTSWVLVRMTAQFVPPDLPRLEAVGLHLPVLLFAICTEFVAVVMAALAPAYFASRVQASFGLGQASRAVTGQSRTRRAFAILQVALVLVLLVGEGLLLRSLDRLLKVNPGFSTSGILTMHLAITRAKYPQDRDVAAYYERLEERIRAIPGILAVGFVNRLPFSATAQTGTVQFEDRPELGEIDTDWRSATPHYFEAIGIPLVRGRGFTSLDRENTPRCGLIDERLARFVYGNKDPLGRRFRVSAGSHRGPWTEIVGIVGHIQNDGPGQGRRPQVYWPETQRAQDRAALVIRTTGDPLSYVNPVRRQIAAENPDQAVYQIRTMDEWLRVNTSTHRTVTGLLGLFSLCSLTLACLGVYAVIAYATRLRVREFGIRLALGAGPSSVMRMILSEAGKLALFGIAAGSFLVLPLRQIVGSLLFGVSSSDSLTLSVAPAVLMLAVLGAAVGPAWRAARVDPASTLREE